jgi:plastocyanin
MDALGRRHLGICLTLAFSLAACGGEGGETGGGEQARAAEEQPAAEAATTGGGESGYTVVAVEDGGTIRGTVSFTGTVPEPVTIEVTDDVDACGASAQTPGLEVDADGGLRNAVVSLVDITSGAAVEASASPPTVDQNRCRFSPHVILVAVDEVVEILNSDPVSHNVHTVAFDNRPFNRTQPPSLEKLEASFDIAEKVRVKCDIHGWMGAWFVVIDHPYHAITDGDGTFVIGNVPAGTYTLEIWHETLGATTQAVTVTAGQAAEVNAELTQDSP